MDGYLELFFRTGSPVFFTAAKRKRADGTEAETETQWRKKS